MVIYRPQYVSGIEWDGSNWIPSYGLGPLRARLFGIRVPILWAWDAMIFAGKIVPPVTESVR